MPRGPLLEFDLEGPESPALLMPRTETAVRQTLFLTSLLEEGGIEVDADVVQLITDIVGFAGSPWLTDGVDDVFADFLEDGLGSKPDPSRLDSWQDSNIRARDVLRPRIESIASYSAPESPGLLIPQLKAAWGESSFERITRTLVGYCDLLESLDSMSNEDDPTFADDFLNSLADYGANYELVVETRVPLDEPFLLKYSERRSLALSSWRNRGSQEMVVADARTNHVTFRVLDPSVRIRKFSAKRPGSDINTFGTFVSREDDQTKSFYAYGNDRDYSTRLDFQLGLLRRLVVVPYYVATILLLAIAALWVERPHEISDLTLIVGLSALAASVLYARESSTLGSRLRLAGSIVVALTVALLIASAVVLYVEGQESSPAPLTDCHESRLRSSQTGECHG